MHTVLVYVHVNEDSIEAFRAATIRNASNSRMEEGIARFDVIQQSDDPSRFILIEVYKNEDAPALHKQTAHYVEWRQAVEPLMAEPRRGVRFEVVDPGEEGW